MASPPAQLSGVLSLRPDAAVLTVYGAVDLATVGVFGGLVDEALAADRPRVVVDLAGLDFLDGQGLHVLVSGAERARLTGSRLVLRAVPHRIRRLLAVTSLLGTFGLAEWDAGQPRVQLPPGGDGVPRIRDVLDAAFALVVTMAQSVIAGADGVSITLPRAGRLATVAASNDVVLQMDHDQYRTGQGPCLDAATVGERFQIATLADEARWPDFVPLARARGIESILSTPLVAGDQPVGALNVYSRTRDAFADHEREWADSFASGAAQLLMRADPGKLSSAAAASKAHDLHQALLSRQSIALAQGVVMQRDGLSASAAHAVLRTMSRETSRPMRAIAEDLVGPPVEEAPRAGS